MTMLIINRRSLYFDSALDGGGDGKSAIDLRTRRWLQQTDDDDEDRGLKVLALAPNSQL